MQARQSALVAVFALASMVFAASAAKATVINIGDLGSQTSGCTHAAGDAGLVCSSPQNFTDGTLSFQATGWSGAPGTSTETAITFKPDSAPFGGAPANGLDESGLGQNTKGPGNPCDEPNHAADCEIGGQHSVAIVASHALDVLDVGVGSVQSGEMFQIFTGTSLADLTAMGGLQSCGSTVCEINLPAGIFAVGVEAGPLNTGDILLTQVSYNAVPIPEPASLVLLGSALVAAGCVFRRRRSIKLV